MKETIPNSQTVPASYDLALEAAFSSNAAYDALETITEEKSAAQEPDSRVISAQKEFSNLLKIAGVVTTECNPNCLDCIKSPKELDFITLGVSTESEEVAYINEANLREIIDYLYQDIYKPRFISKFARIIYSGLTNRNWFNNPNNSHKQLPAEYFYIDKDKPEKVTRVDGLLVCNMQDIAMIADDNDYARWLPNWGIATMYILQEVSKYMGENANRLIRQKRNQE